MYIRTYIVLSDKSVKLQWTPSNPATLGTNKSVLIRGVVSFQGGTCIEFVLHIKPSKWPEYRGGHISGIQIRGSSL